MNSTIGFKSYHSRWIFFLRWGQTTNHTTRAVAREQPREMPSVPHQGTWSKPSTGTHTHTEGNKLMTKNTRGWRHITAIKCEQKCDIIYIMDIAMNSLCFVNSSKLSAVQRCALLFSKACSNHDIALEQTLKG